jgi:hypothetical protein
MFGRPNNLSLAAALAKHPDRVNIIKNDPDMTVVEARAMMLGYGAKTFREAAQKAQPALINTTPEPPRPQATINTRIMSASEAARSPVQPATNISPGSGPPAKTMRLNDALNQLAQDLPTAEARDIVRPIESLTGRHQNCLTEGGRAALLAACESLATWLATRH